MKTRPAVTVLLLATVLGCGGGSIKREDLNTELVKALCATYAKCGVALSEAGCTQALQPLITQSATDPYADLIAAGKIKYDGAQARKCLDAYVGQACSNTIFSVAPEQCQHVYEGQVAVGQPCSLMECVSSAYCSLEVDGKCPASCKDRLAAGSAATSSVQCVLGLTVADGLCAKLGTEGARCTGSDFGGSCGPDLFCAPDTLLCKKTRLVGESCGSTERCSGWNFCSSGLCAKPGDVGANCTQTAGTGFGGAACKVELVCDTSLPAAVCKARLAEGATCTGISSGDCNFGLACSPSGGAATTCQKPGGIGQACIGGSCASDLFCETASKLCKTRLAPGSPCTEFDSCNGGNYCQTGTCKTSSLTCN